MTNSRILVVDDEEGIRYSFCKYLGDGGYNVVSAQSYKEALEKITQSEFDLIFTDIFLGDETGIDLLEKVKEMKLLCPVVVFSGSPSLETASKAVRLGAFDYLVKPLEKQSILNTARLALKQKSLIDEKEKYRSNLEAIFRSVSDSIITVDKQLNIIELNAAAEKMSGVSRKKAINKKLSIFKECCETIFIDALTETINKGKPVELFRVKCNIEGPERKVVNLATYPLINIQNAITGAVLIIKDVTHLSSLEKIIQKQQQFNKIVSKSDKMQRVYSMIEKLSDVATTVLIKGESGTGKELVAEALHYEGNRRDKPLVKVNCSALTENLLESELFGHVKGAFTDANENKIGRFEMANGGTILLDEIGDISMRIQMRLLRILQNKELEKVGSSKPIKIDVRILAATNQNLVEKIKLGLFREDLFYRIKVVEINLPALRERIDDVPLLTDHFINKFNKKFDKDITRVSEDVKRKFLNYLWPGNIRELEHAMEHACVLCKGNIITLEDLPPEISSFTKPLAADLDKKTNDRGTIVQALEKTGGNKAKASRILGISRQTLYQKIKEYNISSNVIH